MIAKQGLTTKASCAYLLTQALVQTHDDLLEVVMGESLQDYDADELVLDAEVIPTWGELTGRQAGGNQNTVRYAHYDG